MLPPESDPPQPESDPLVQQQVPSPKPTTRKGKIRKPLTSTQIAAAEHKLSLLSTNFNPTRFSPSKPLDFSSSSHHQLLFKSLNLLDFATLDLTFDLRPDLLTHLIANYDPTNRRSLVHNSRISLTKSDLARALHLPLKKEKLDNHELFVKPESVAVIEEFMRVYVMLEDDDMCILPDDVVAAGKLVKEGMVGKVDWAGIMWMLVEKELLYAPRVGSCRYASHLQCLMMRQKPGLFEEEEVVLESDNEEEDVNGNDNVEGEKEGPTLCLGIGEDEVAMECEEEGKNAEVEEFANCDMEDVRGMEFENLCKGEEEEGRVAAEEEFENLARLPSTDLLQAMETVRVVYSPSQMETLNISSGEFLSARVDGDKNMTLESPAVQDGSLFFGDNGKRHIDEVDDEDDEDGMNLFHHNSQQKRMRDGGHWQGHTPSGFDSVMEQMQCVMGKAKLQFVEKEQQCIDAQLQLQYLNEMLEQKDHIIRSLETARVEEQHKWQEVFCRYENEVSIMVQLVNGYKKALKETRNKFAEYRKKCPQVDEPLYRDVAGTGGLVLSTGEIERQRLLKEQEKRQIAVDVLQRFEIEWTAKFKEHSDSLGMLCGRLLQLHGKIEDITERFAEMKGSDT